MVRGASAKKWPCKREDHGEKSRAGCLTANSAEDEEDPQAQGEAPVNGEMTMRHGEILDGAGLHSKGPRLAAATRASWSCS